MFTKYMMIILMGLGSISIAAYTSSSSISTCMTYESDASKKWCRYSTSTSSGYAGDASDSSSVGGGGTYYRGSSDSSTYLPQNSKKLLGPTDYTNCNTQAYYLYSSSSSITQTSGYFGTSTFGWYKFIPYSSDIYKVNIKINSLVNATAEVYYESMTNSYTYKGSLSSGGSMDISVGYYDPVWVLIIPSSNNAYVSVTGTQSSSSSYDSYSDNSTYLVAILVPTIVGGTLLIIVMVVIIVGGINGKVRKDLNQASEAVVNPFERPSRPQIYYPSQRNYSEGNVNQGTVAMGTPQPAVQLKQNKKQKIYIIEPVPTKPVEPKSYDPADPVLETSIHVGEGEPVSQKQ